MNIQISDEQLTIAAQNLIRKNDNALKEYSVSSERKSYFPAIKKAKARSGVFHAINNGIRSYAAIMIAIAVLVSCVLMGAYMGKNSYKVNASFDAVLWRNHDDGSFGYRNVTLKIEGKKQLSRRPEVYKYLLGDLVVTDATGDREYLSVYGFETEEYDKGYTLTLKSSEHKYLMTVDRLKKDFTIRFYGEIDGVRGEYMVTVNTYTRNEAVALTRKIWKSYQYGVMDCTDSEIENQAAEMWR